MTGAEELARALGSPLPPGIAKLRAADARRLAELIDQARADQSRRLDEAIDGGLQHLPRLVRGTARTILFR